VIWNGAAWFGAGGVTAVLWDTSVSEGLDDLASAGPEDTRSVALTANRATAVRHRTPANTTEQR
jgi:hypothetical protein